MSSSLDDMKPTKLGTKEHWDSVYEEEIANFNEHGDEGEIWFGEDSVEKMVKWGLSTLPPDPDLSILEIGCGNGTLLSAMAQAGYAQKSLVGIDYSEDAVKLAQLVAESKGLDSIAFHRCDFLNESPPLPDSVSKTTDAEETSSWDLLLDKGTFDAIALGAKAPEGKNPAEAYPPRVSRLLKPGGMFLITSCNFTEDELKTVFLKDPALQYQYVTHK